MAHQIAQSLVDLYGAKIEVLSAAWLERGQEADTAGPDALVLFGMTLALRFFSDTALQPLWHKALIVLDSDTVLPGPEAQKLGLAGAILTANPSLSQMCQATGLPPWKFPLLLDEALENEGATFALAQPLSLILGDKNRLAASEQPAASGLHNGDQRMTLPVWLYWEGECPEWIKACQRTIFAHASDVRLLTPETFTQWWDTDRDIDLSRLQPAHRADFIRAFLLVRYGGLWIDSDCLVMQPLRSILDALWEHDFIGHRERSHYVPNGFIGARPRSQIAAAFYHRICAILRSGQPLGWISLGGQPLTDIINTSGVPWYEIECERIQPICWSNPGAFFAVRDHGEHEQAFDDRAICYMLSNTSIQQYQATHPQQNLLNEGTFFHYLLHKALKEDKLVRPVLQTAGHAHGWQLIPFCLEALMDIAPRRVLDVGVGLGRWGLLIRECFEEPKSRDKHEDWQCYVAGIGLPLGGGSDHLRPFYNCLHSGDVAALISGMTDHWDVAIFGPTLPPWSRETAEQVLHNALEFSDYVLVNLPLIPPQHGYPNETHLSGWSLDDLLAFYPVRYATEEKPQGHTHGRLSKNAL